MSDVQSLSLFNVKKRQQIIDDDDLVYKFFENLELGHEHKDYFIRDFEDYFFQERPQFTEKVIKFLIDVSDLSSNKNLG